MTISFASTRGMDTARAAGAHVPARASLVATVALLATAIDLSVAIVYWAPFGVTPMQILRSVATWVLGPGIPATLAVMALGLAMLLAIYLAMVAVFEIAVAPNLLQARPRYLIGVIYGTAAYVVAFQMLVPMLAHPVLLNRTIGWVVTCLSAHALVIGPLIASSLTRPIASHSHPAGANKTC